MYDIFKRYSKKIKYIDSKNIFKAIYGIIFKRKIIIKGFNSGKIIEQITNKACNNKGFYNIKDIEKPLLITSIDLYTGNIICFCSKQNRNTFSDDVIYVNDVEIGNAVKASCSYPAVFEPCKFENIELIDGGIRENVPWKETKKMGAEKVISVVFETERKKYCCENIIDVVSTSLNILNHELKNYELEGADFLIKIKTGEIGLLDTSKIEELYKIGYETAKKNINKIKELLFI